MDAVSEALHEIVGYLGALFAILFVVSVYCAYEFNRRLQIIPKATHPYTRKLFNYLRSLFLFLALYFSTHLVYSINQESTPIVCLILAIVRLISYIGIIAMTLSLALSPILTIGRIRDNQEDVQCLGVKNS